METARKAVEELESIAAGYKRPLFEAGALTAKGELLLGEDRPSEASPILGRSWRLWLDNDLPYESARARLRYAEAIAAEGDMATAQRDFRAARVAFERLGATSIWSGSTCCLGKRTCPRPPRGAGHQDVHVHRHRHLDGPDRGRG